VPLNPCATGVTRNRIAPRLWRLQVKRSMWSGIVVVSGVGPEDLLEVAPAEHERPVKTFGPHRADPSLGNAFARGARRVVAELRGCGALAGERQPNPSKASRDAGTSTPETGTPQYSRTYGAHYTGEGRIEDLGSRAGPATRSDSMAGQRRTRSNARHTRWADP
jgi:hypothetical protein